MEILIYIFLIVKCYYKLSIKICNIPTKNKIKLREEYTRKQI